MYFSASKPADTDVQWKDFIGFTEGDYTIGSYRSGSGNRWLPTDDSFMNSNPCHYVPMYHRWIIYDQVMKLAETPKTLADFTSLMGITLPNGSFGPNPSTGIEDITGSTSVMYAFLAFAVVLWGYIFRKTRMKNV